MKTVLALVGALAAFRPPGAAAAEIQGFEELTFLGWNRACAAALKHVRYTPSGKGLGREPSWWRIGSMTLRPAETAVKTEWLADSTAMLRWNEGAAQDAEATLQRAGYTRAGLRETVRPERTARRGGMERVLRSTVTFEVRHPVDWPAPDFALAGVNYSPLGNCALLAYRRDAPTDSWRYLLVRIAPNVRRRRAQAHVTNGLLLYQEGELDGGRAELAIAAAMDPEFPPARYHHAVLLGAEGRFDEALAELAAAVKLDRRYKARAREASEFEDIRGDRRYKEIVE